MSRPAGPAIDQAPIGRPFELAGGGRALFTGREHGNMSSVGGDACELASAAREGLRELIGARALVRGHQVHGTAVRRIAAVADEREASAGASPSAGEVDGQATALRGVATMVMSADCLPVALGCAGAVAMVHAGWRGLAAGVLEQGVLALRELGRGTPKVAIVGPCAGACCYEVGPEVHEAFAGAHAHGRRIDLRAIAHERLSSAGVAELRDVHACTICDERYFSYRREGAHAGRQAGIAWLS
jgi:YfiH family protein